MRHRKTKNKLPPFLPLFNETLDAPATKALSHGAFRLYAVLKREFNPYCAERKNGLIYLSLRQAEEETGSHRDYIARWYRELQFYGFIVMTQQGCLGTDGKGKAPKWRLTELRYMGEPPTKDFLRWNGVKFSDREKQNPDPQKRDRVTHKSGTGPTHKSGSPEARSDPQSGSYGRPSLTHKRGSY